jgi:hypothetical protein
MPVNQAVRLLLIVTDTADQQTDHPVMTNGFGQTMKTVSLCPCWR